MDKGLNSNFMNSPYIQHFLTLSCKVKIRKKKLQKFAGLISKRYIQLLSAREICSITVAMTPKGAVSQSSYLF